MFYLKRSRTVPEKSEMVKTSTENPETVKILTAKLKKLTVKFDRVSYRAAYDKWYFKRTAKCPNCGQVKVRHMMNRHMKTVKCKMIKN